jgi:hypothetical protein
MGMREMGFEWTSTSTGIPPHMMEVEVKTEDLEEIRFRRGHYNSFTGEWYDANGNRLTDVIGWRYLSNFEE